MLSELHIEDLGVIRRVSLVLGEGLTAITGETGAGKTMLVEALELVVGGRAEPTMVRAGASEARIDARFVHGETEIVLSRVIPAHGRSRAYIDGRPVTVTALADTATDLVDLHGQHAHQQLLSSGSQRAALDAFGNVDLQPLREARGRLTEIDAELATIGGDERTRARELDLARFQLAELEAAAVEDPGEEAALDTLEDTLAGAVEHREAGAAAYEALSGEGGARDTLGSALAALAGRAPYRDLADRLTSVLAELDDVMGDVRDTADEIEQDPERLESVRARRQQLRDLCRKYGDDLAEVMRYHREVADRVAEIEGYEARAARLDAARREALDALARAAAAVGAARREAAPRLAEAVTARLADLAMPHATVDVDVPESGPGDDGSHVTFLMSANPGSPLLPLTKVASGGELARTMLALRLVMIGLDDGGEAPSTLIFDEVDAGIGGTAATAVGAALAKVGTTHQVLVVTHLAQVAAQATTQVTVTKRIVDGGTDVEAAAVSGEQRVEEVARMLSGDLSERGGSAAAAARRHAAELLAK